MNGFITENRLYQFTSRMIADGQSVINVFHMRPFLPSGVSPRPLPNVTLQVALGDVVDAWNAMVDPLLCTNTQTIDMEMMEIVGRTVPPVGQPPQLVVDEFALNATNPPVEGGQADPLPTYCALGIRKITNRRGRSWRGGIRLSAVPEDGYDDNTITGPYAAIVATNTAWMTAGVVITGGDLWRWGLTVFGETAYLRPGSAESLISASPLVVAAQPRKYASSQVSRKRTRLFGN